MLAKYHQQPPALSMFSTYFPLNPLNPKTTERWKSNLHLNLLQSPLYHIVSCTCMHHPTSFGFTSFSIFEHSWSTPSLESRGHPSLGYHLLSPLLITFFVRFVISKEPVGYGALNKGYSPAFYLNSRGFTLVKPTCLRMNRFQEGHSLKPIGHRLRLTIIPSFLLYRFSGLHQKSLE